MLAANYTASRINMNPLTLDPTHLHLWYHQHVDGSKYQMCKKNSGIITSFSLGKTFFKASWTSCTEPAATPLGTLIPYLLIKSAPCSTHETQISQLGLAINYQHDHKK
jgi:hypothetical protein